MMFLEHLVNFDWLFNTQSRVLQADWFILEIMRRQLLPLTFTLVTFALMRNEFFQSMSGYIWLF